MHRDKDIRTSNKINRRKRLGFNKSIGYFLSKADCKKLFVKDYRDILYEIKYGENSNFYAELIVNRLKEKPSDDIMHSFEHTYFMSMLSAESNAENVVDKLLTIVNMCDDYKGLLFQTIALNQENRRDECLDYYDNNFGFKCKKLNRGIIVTGKQIGRAHV